MRRQEQTLEIKRLAALRRYGILDTPAEGTFDNIVELASTMCSAPIAVVSLVDEYRQWFKARVGLAPSETPREIAFCAHAIQQDDMFVVDDATRDPRFKDNPLVVGTPNVRFYAGMPLRTIDGFNLGTLCIIDSKLHTFDDEQRRTLALLAQQTEVLLTLRLALREVSRLGTEVARQHDALLLLEQERRDLAVTVVHDLKSPLMCILAEADFIQSSPLDADNTAALETIREAATIMQRLTFDLLDVSRSTNGSLMVRQEDVELRSLVANVGKRAAHRVEQNGIFTSTTQRPVVARVDANLLRRVIENLVDKAIKYGDDQPITLELTDTQDAFEVRVRDRGPGIPLAQREQIFERYVRLEPSSNERVSQGIGLAFCRLAVEAHGGTIWIEDNHPCGVTFCFRIAKNLDLT